MWITCTGVDATTPLNELSALSRDFPFVEWGVLQRTGPHGAKHRRYPPLAALRCIADHLHTHGLRAALHLCGGLVRTFLAQASLGQWPEGWAPTVAAFGRIQLNARLSAEHIAAVQALAGLQAQARAGAGDVARLIVQWNPHNQGYWSALAGPQPLAEGVAHLPACLVDASGGRGLLPQEWPARTALPPTAIGYAGGLSAERLPAQWPHLMQAAGGLPDWLDLETSLRDEHDGFCVKRCAQVLEVAARLRG